MSSNEKFERDFESFLNGDDASLSALYRKLPRAEPGAKLDEAVLAMAHRALNPQLVATPGPARASPARRRARWLPALGVAASAVFAIGVAVKMAPRMWSEQHRAAPAAARDEGVVHVRPIDAPAAAPEPPMSPPPPTQSTAAGAAAPQREVARAAPKPAAPPPPATALQKSTPAPAPAPMITAEAPPPERADAKKVENVASPAPQAFPAQPSRTSEMDAVERKEAIAEGAWHRLHDSDSAAPAGAAANAAPAAAPAARAKTSAGGAAAALSAQSRDAEEQKSLEPVTVTGSHIRRVEVETASPSATIDRAAVQKPISEAAQDKASRTPPAKPDYSAEVLRNAKRYPESWMGEIQRLLRVGKRDEARQNLTLFREKYPDYKLPPDIERLAREPQ